MSCPPAMYIDGKLVRPPSNCVPNYPPTVCEKYGGIWCTVEKFPPELRIYVSIFILLTELFLVLLLIALPAIIARLIVKRFITNTSAKRTRLIALVSGSVIVLPILIYYLKSYSVAWIVATVVVISILYQYIVLLCIDNRKIKMLIFGLLILPLMFLITFGYIFYNFNIY